MAEMSETASSPANCAHLCRGTQSGFGLSGFSPPVAMMAFGTPCSLSQVKGMPFFQSVPRRQSLGRRADRHWRNERAHT